jgi:hypothetical protein
MQHNAYEIDQTYGDQDITQKLQYDSPSINTPTFMADDGIQLKLSR